MNYGKRENLIHAIKTNGEFDGFVKGSTTHEIKEKVKDTEYKLYGKPWKIA